MAIISLYKLIEILGVGFRVMNLGGTPLCPICSGLLGEYGTRKRKYIDANWIKQTLIIRRLLCAGCGAIHHELPDILVPYKRHCAQTIENVIYEVDVGDNVENSTIHRIRGWWRNLRVYIQGILGSLNAKYGIRFSDPFKLKEVVRALANSSLWISTRSACTPL